MRDVIVRATLLGRLIVAAQRVKNQIYKLALGMIAMDVKEAVKIAKQYTADVFDDEGVRGLALEEIEYDESSGDWLVTVSFLPKLDPMASLGKLAGIKPLARQYKVVRIDNRGNTLSIKRRYQDDAPFNS